MDATTATAFMTANKGETIIVTLIDGTEIYGNAISVNSKGVNIKNDQDKVQSIGLKRVDMLNLVPGPDADDLEDDDLDAREIRDLNELEVDDEDFNDLAAEMMFDDGTVIKADDEDVPTLDDKLNGVADEISDGASTTEVAAALSDVLGRELTPKELRVHLRALGLGVGKGRKYVLSVGELRAVHTLINS